MMIAADLVSLLVYSLKDRLEQEEIEKIRAAFEQLQRADAASRRMKADAEIRQLAKLEIELKRFAFSYGKVQQKTGCRIPAMEQYMGELTARIKEARQNKNRKH